MQLNIKPNESIKLVSNLYDLSEDSSCYKLHKIPFPAELLLGKLKKVSWSLDEVIKIKDEQWFDEGQNEKIIFDYVKYLDDLNDSLLQVMKALTPYTISQEDIKEADKWLKKYNSDNYTKFKDVTLADNEFIRVSSNNIKHGNVKITPLSITNHNNKKVFGFYFADILDEEQLSGPKSEIHKPYKNTTTAFSFNHFLLRTAGVMALNFYWLNKILFKNEKHLTVMYQKYMKNEDVADIRNINWTLKFNSHDGKSNEKLPYLSLRRPK